MQEELKKSKNMSKKEQNSNEEGRIGVGKIIKLVGLTILSMVGAFCFFVVCTGVVAPRSLAGGLKACGCDRAYYLVYKRIYNRDKTNENLYNCIQIAVERKDYDDMEHYIKVMLNGDKFDKFAKKIDAQTSLALGDKYCIYIDSYESYLKEQLVLALYHNGNTLEAKMRALDSVFEGINEMYVYAICVDSDENLTDLEKATEISSFSRYEVGNKLEDKISELDDDYNLETTPQNKLVVLEQMLRVAEIQYIIASHSGVPQDDIDVIKLRINEWKQEIKTLSLS